MTPAIEKAILPIPFFDYPSVFTSQEESFIEILRDVGRRGAYILQKDLVNFERHLAEFLRATCVAGVGNATDGLIIGLRAAGLQPGDEVILSSHTMIATAAAIHFAGGVPVPVECGLDHLIDPAAVEAAITSRTRAVLPTQLNGRTCDMDTLQRIANRSGLIIVEDAAQALGSRFRGRFAGTFGAAAAISFYPAKVLGCFGDGGAVVTSSQEVHEKVCQLRDHGRNAEGEIASWGLNSRLDNLQAAFLDFQLKAYDQVIVRRRRLAGIYCERLREVAALILPPAPGADADHFDIYQNYEIEADQRDRLKQFLKENGVGTLIQWGGQAIHMLSSLGFKKELPSVDRLFERLLLLPMNMSLSDDQADYLCEKVRKFYGYPA